MTDNISPKSSEEDDRDSADLIFAHRQEMINNLAEVASTIALDLQTLLRSLTMFTKLLARDYQNELDEKGQQYLDFITASSSRMQSLINDLLVYARAARGEQTWVMVDFERVVEQIIQEHHAISKTKARITVRDLPQILLDPQEIHQLFQNLLDNAIKFGGQTPQIEISAIAREREWLIAVADNGIGIKPEFHSQIFQVFQRLNPIKLYPGNGMGLTICQKIVQRYGGKIWVDSTFGRGSTFYFTLPRDVSQLPITS